MNILFEKPEIGTLAVMPNRLCESYKAIPYAGKASHYSQTPLGRNMEGARPVQAENGNKQATSFSSCHFPIKVLTLE